MFLIGWSAAQVPYTINSGFPGYTVPAAPPPVVYYDASAGQPFPAARQGFSPPSRRGWLVYGSHVVLRHVETGKRLHSHEHPYEGGSGQQQVTGFDGSDDNDWWVVKGPHGDDAPDGQPLPQNGALRLMHRQTRRNLHSHEIESPCTGQQEVTCFGDDGEGDENDNWLVVYSGDKLRLVHAMTGKRLHSHGTDLPDWGFGQQEVTCFEGEDDNDYWQVQEQRRLD